jgi:hypothetical protein
MIAKARLAPMKKAQASKVKVEAGESGELIVRDPSASPYDADHGRS